MEKKYEVKETGKDIFGNKKYEVKEKSTSNSWTESLGYFMLIILIVNIVMGFYTYLLNKFLNIIFIKKDTPKKEKEDLYVKYFVISSIISMISFIVYILWFFQKYKEVSYLNGYHQDTYETKQLIGSFISLLFYSIISGVIFSIIGFRKLMKYN